MTSLNETAVRLKIFRHNLSYSDQLIKIHAKFAATGRETCAYWLCFPYPFHRLEMVLVVGNGRAFDTNLPMHKLVTN